MLINKMRIKGLNNVPGWIEVNFHPDINILTGRNGAGKTTLLKAIWYGISGNLEHLMRDIVFDAYEIETSEYSLSLERRIHRAATKGQRELESWTVRMADELGLDLAPRKTESRDRIERGASAIDSANQIILNIDGNSSVFFPTFRRIEGGFGMGDVDSRYPQHRYAPASQMQEALESLSESLTTLGHKFVASTSTSDLRALLNSRYAEISNSLNVESGVLLERITSLVKGNRQGSIFTSDVDAVYQARQTLDEINRAAEAFERRREITFAPFNVLLSLVETMLTHKGVRLTDTLIAGDAASAIDSTKLSAGEKQMLSFLCYNAFAFKSAIFIDEPELSLHVDWQRLLVKTLVAQQAKNQYFIATHSPFIYSQYADKEISVSADRGFENDPQGKTAKRRLVTERIHDPFKKWHGEL